MASILRRPGRLRVFVVPALCRVPLFIVILFTLTVFTVPGVQAVTPPNQLNVTPNPRTAGEIFGNALALQGDTLAVGVPNANVDGAEGQGAVVIFTRAANGEWQQVKRITANDGEAFDGFGRSAIALEGDTLLVSAIYAEIAGNTNQGAAYVFERNQGGPNNWGQVAKLTGSMDDPQDRFGTALVVHGDDVFVASPEQGGERTGMVYHFRRNEGGPNAWGETQQLFDDERRTSDNFGTSLAFDGATLVVGSSRTDVTGLHENDGAAFVFAESALDSGVWQETGKLTASDADGSDHFGSSVALLDDLIAIGAPAADNDNADNDNAGLDAGKVYLFARSSSEWSEVAILTGSDAGAIAHFGRALAIYAEGVIVSAEVGNGTLYVFADAGDSSASQTNSPHAWQEATRYSADAVEFFQSGYGSVLATDGAWLAVGAPQIDALRGGAYLYPVANLLDEQPIQETAHVYLPNVATNLAVVGITDILTAGGRVVGPDGAGIAAPTGSLTSSIGIGIQPVTAPSTPHDDPITVVSNHYVFGSEIAVHTPMTQPLILALPVPAGTDPSQLAVAALSSPDMLLDDELIDPEWLYYEGEYDAANQRFLTTWAALNPQGMTFVVVQHPEFEAAAQVASSDAVQFNVRCLGFYSDSGCSSGTRFQAAEILSDIHERMTAQGGFGFDEPRLRNLAENLNFDTSSLASLGYMVYIERNTARPCGSRLAGYYAPVPGRLVLCLAVGGTIDDDKKRTLIHEYFHATQYAYNDVFNDWMGRRDDKWVIEGMTTAAMESFFHDTTLRRTDKFPIHPVDIPFDSEEAVDEYSAQDFWVYVGQAFAGASNGMGYFEFILQNGADKSAVDEALRQHFSTNLKDQMWDWASNQVLEKENDLDDALGEACKLEENVLQKGIENVWELVGPHQTSYWPPGAGPATATVPAYTTMVIELKFPYDSEVSEEVRLIYPECDYDSDPDAQVQCYQNAQDRLPAQLYVENGSACFDQVQGRMIDPAIGGRTFEGIQTSQRYFAVVTNVTENDQSFRMMAELTQGLR